MSSKTIVMSKKVQFKSRCRNRLKSKKAQAKARKNSVDKVIEPRRFTLLVYLEQIM
jgi:hypothetical protein